jgi:hypothetical protein
MRRSLELISSPVGGRLLVDEKRGAGWCAYVDTLPLLPGRDEGAQRMVDITSQSYQITHQYMIRRWPFTAWLSLSV